MQRETTKPRKTVSYKKIFFVLSCFRGCVFGGDIDQNPLRALRPLRSTVENGT